MLLNCHTVRGTIWLMKIVNKTSPNNLLPYLHSDIFVTISQTLKHWSNFTKSFRAKGNIFWHTIYMKYCRILNKMTTFFAHILFWREKYKKLPSSNLRDVLFLTKVESNGIFVFLFVTILFFNMSRKLLVWILKA